MIRIPGKIPVIIHPTFWLVAAIIGYVNSHFSWLGTLVWMFVIFVSVIIHEFGHATTALLFGLKPHIELIALGGVTYHQGEKLSLWKQFFIVLNGPVFGFFLFIIASILLGYPQFQGGFTGAILQYFYWVNLIWTILNLVPVMPLDGGQLLRIIMESIFGIRGFGYSLIIGAILAVLLSLIFFLFQQYLAGALFFLFAFQSYDTWKKTRAITEKDRSEELKLALENAENELQVGNKNQALNAFEEIRTKAKKGMIYILATQYLAFLKYDLGKVKEAYELLLSIRNDLSPEGLCLLHKAAFDQKDYKLVNELSASCFQSMPVAEVALRNACASAALSQAQPAVGWLETAFQEGLENIQEIVRENIFDPIRTDPHFQAFLKHHAT